MQSLFGGIEAGGTKFVCALGQGPGEILDRVEIRTRDPGATVPDVIRFFDGHAQAGRRITSLGIGSFGPLDTNPASGRYGEILKTPKQGWAGINLRELLVDALGVPVVVDTDVNAAMLAEYQWGAAQGMLDVLYVTVGTGIGVGALLGGKLYAGVHHPEMGHIRLPISPDELPDFAGTCPFHGACAEGLASGHALVERWGRQLSVLPHEHAAWSLEAEYLAMLFSDLTFAFQPQRIIVGGGVSNAHLLDLTRRQLPALLGGYHTELHTEADLADYIVPPSLGDDVGILGAIATAYRTREMEQAMLAGEIERQSDA